MTIISIAFYPIALGYQSYLKDKYPKLVGWWFVTLLQISSKFQLAGVAPIERYEGLRLNAYQCPAGIWTIGYGHTKGVFLGNKITRPQAQRYFWQDSIVYEDAVKRALGKLQQAIEEVENVSPVEDINSLKTEIIETKQTLESAVGDRDSLPKSDRNL